MSTTKPRITVTLEPHAHEVLARLSAASGESMSQIVAGFVDLAVPSLERVVVVLERAKTAPEEVRAGLGAALARAEREIVPMALAVLDQSDLFLDAAVIASEPTPAGRARRGTRAAGVVRLKTPVLVTRGSGRVKTRTKVPSTGGKP